MFGNRALFPEHLPPEFAHAFDNEQPIPERGLCRFCANIDWDAVLEGRKGAAGIHISNVAPSRDGRFAFFVIPSWNDILSNTTCASCRLWAAGRRRWMENAVSYEEVHDDEVYDEGVNEGVDDEVDDENREARGLEAKESKAEDMNSEEEDGGNDHVLETNIDIGFENAHGDGSYSNEEFGGENPGDGDYGNEYGDITYLEDSDAQDSNFEDSDSEPRLNIVSYPLWTGPNARSVVHRYGAADRSTQNPGMRFIDRQSDLKTFRLRVNGGATVDDYSGGLGSESQVPIEVTALLKDLQNNNYLGAGREVHPSCIDSRLPERWLSLCEKKHAEHCSPEIAWPCEKGEFTFRLIDVNTSRVVTCSKPVKYLALSYVWGSILTYTARNQDLSTGENGEKYLQLTPGRLSTGIKDAMQVTKMLDHRYLWVDALCIVQDDIEEKMKTIQMMDKVYRAATLTIVSATNKSVTQGFPGLHPSSRNVQQVIETIAGHSFLLTQPRLDHLLRASIWSTRAWTYQEERFSRRQLIFSDQGLYFKCQRRTWAEDSLEEGLEAICEALASRSAISVARPIRRRRSWAAKPRPIEAHNVHLDDYKAFRAALHCDDISVLPRKDNLPLRRFSWSGLTSLEFNERNNVSNIRESFDIPRRTWTHRRLPFRVVKRQQDSEVAASSISNDKKEYLPLEERAEASGELSKENETPQSPIENLKLDSSVHGISAARLHSASRNLLSDISPPGQKQTKIPTETILAERSNRERLSFRAYGVAQKLESTFAHYTYEVSAITRRTLKYRSDALNAFAGISHELIHSQHLYTTAIVGLPKEQFSAALLWKGAKTWFFRDWDATESPPLPQPWGSGPPCPLGFRAMDEVMEEMGRIQKLIEQDGKLQVLKRSKDDSSGRDIFPSWSWAGWVGAITYYPKGVRDREYKLLETIESAIVWPWEECASRAEEHAAIQRVLDTEILDIEAEVAIVDLSHLDTSPVEWPGWPLDNGKWSRWGRFECILLSRQLRDPIYDEPILKHEYLAPKYRIGPLKVKELDDSGEEVEREKCLVNLMVVELGDGGIMRRKGLVMLREDIWAFFAPVRKNIRLG